jgi:hypothetical protein
LSTITRIFVISIGVGIIATLAFVAVAVGAIFMTGGDGSAPAITHFMLGLTNVPVKLLGLPHQGAVYPAGVFWGTISAAITFVLLLFTKMFR